MNMRGAASHPPAQIGALQSTLEARAWRGPDSSTVALPPACCRQVERRQGEGEIMSKEYKMIDVVGSIFIPFNSSGATGYSLAGDADERVEKCAAEIVARLEEK